MTNYERKKNMTIEEMAEDNTRLELAKDEELIYETSDGNEFNDKETALEHEIDWLSQEAEDE